MFIERTVLYRILSSVSQVFSLFLKLCFSVCCALTSRPGLPTLPQSAYYIDACLFLFFISFLPVFRGCAISLTPHLATVYACVLLLVPDLSLSRKVTVFRNQQTFAQTYNTKQRTNNKIKIKMHTPRPASRPLEDPPHKPVPSSGPALAHLAEL